MNLLKPPQLVAVVCGLAGLGHRDLLLMDELARWGRAWGGGGAGWGPWGFARDGKRTAPQPPLPSPGPRIAN
jgi:hypothetical protein